MHEIVARSAASAVGARYHFLIFSICLVLRKAAGEGEISVHFLASHVLHINPPGPSWTPLASGQIITHPTRDCCVLSRGTERSIFRLLFPTLPRVDSRFMASYFTWRFCSFFNIASSPFDKMCIDGTCTEDRGGSTSATATTKPLALLISFLAVLTATYLFQQKRRQLPLPPGPRGVPIFGNLFQVALKYQWRQQQEWTQKYGPIFRMRLGAQTVMVLGTHQAARDLLDKRSKIYSDRPELVVCAKHLSGGTFLPAFILAHSSVSIISQIHYTYANQHT